MFLYYKIILKITLGKKRHIFLKTKLYNYVMIIKLKKKLQSYNLGFLYCSDTAMDILDGDDVRLSYNGVYAERDIVQVMVLFLSLLCL